MTFCTACGTPVEGRFCPKCGGAVGAATGIPVNASPTLAATPDTNAGLTENAVGALCYLGGLVTGIIFLLIAPYNVNPRIKFHAFQSILFNLAWVLAWLVLIPMGMILPFGLSLLMSLFSLLIWAGGLVLWLFLMWRAYEGRTLSLPVIGAIARQQAAK